MRRPLLALALATQLTPAFAEPQAPPPALLIDGVGESGVDHPRVTRSAEGSPLYSVGEPTDDEQLYLELINRTRADPLAEALRLANLTDPDVRNAYEFFKVDLQKFVNDTAGYPVAQPLAFELRLIEAARGHSDWMLTHGLQDHDQTNPPGSGNVSATLTDRLAAVGYPFSTAGESIYAFAKDPEHGHAGFEVDWGNGPGGMQNPPGHRDSNHNVNFREVGVGVRNGSGPNGVGPQVVTIDFANRTGAGPLVSGVAYYDLNGNEFYDLGEGLGGVSVEVSGATFRAVTAGSGGYTVPSANGSRQVTFSGAGLAPTNVSVLLANGLNAKADLRLSYAAPVLNGPAAPAVGRANAYTFPAVPGATGYSWRAAQTLAWGGLEGAETGGTNFNFVVSPGHNPVTSGSKRTGGFAFQLSHRTGINQFMTFKPTFWARSGARLEFWKRLGFATTAETAVAQVSLDEGVSWTTVWSQAGNGATISTGIEKNFSQVSVDLAQFANRRLQLRFGFLFTSGSLFLDTDPTNRSQMGLFLDDLNLFGVDQLGATTVSEVTGPSLEFSPPAIAGYLLSVQPRNFARLLPSGPVLAVGAVAPPANTAPVLGAVADRTVDELAPMTLQLSATDADLPAQALTFTLVSGPAGLTVASSGRVDWTPGTNAGPSTNVVTVRVSDGTLADETAFKIVVRDTVVTPVVLTGSRLTVGPSGKLRLDFAVSQGSAVGFTLEGTGSLLNRNWAPVTGAVLGTNSPGNFSFRFDPQGEAHFYRVVTP